MIPMMPTEAQIILEILEGMDFPSFVTLLGDTAGAPAFNLHKSSDAETILSIAVPGLREHDVSVFVHDGVLNISGNPAYRDPKQAFEQQGFDIKPFHMAFKLLENVVVDCADCRNGVLTVVLFYKLPEARKPIGIRINQRYMSNPFETI